MVKLGTCSLALLFVAAMSVHAEPAPYTFEVRFDKPMQGPPACAMGVLHSLTKDAPADEWIKPLRLGAFRGQGNDGYLFAPGFVERMRGLGVQHVQVVVSDTFMKYTYAREMSWPGDADDWLPWERHVRAVVDQAGTHGITLQYDIWNEPNIDVFWKRDRARFFEAWRRAVRVIREMDARACIVGPSVTRAPGLNGFDANFLEAFLLFGRDHDALPDVLSWHELIDPHGRDIVRHADQMRRFMRDNNIHVKRISINEIQPSSHHLSPGVAVSYFAGLRAAGVESAMRSCWADDGGPNCGNASLDGLLAMGGKPRPRSIWWAWRACADFTGPLVRVDAVTSRPKGLTVGPWHAVGAFVPKDRSAFDSVFAPETGVDLNDTYVDGRLKWAAMPAWRDGYPHDLSTTFRPPHGGVAGYLYRTITADSPGELPVYLSSDDGIKVWHNGKELLAADKRETDRWIDANPQHTVTLPLKAGTNHLLMKITNMYAFYAFYFSTEPVRGIDVLARRDGTGGSIVLGSTLPEAAAVTLSCSGVKGPGARVYVRTIADGGRSAAGEPAVTSQSVATFVRGVVHVQLTVPAGGVCIVDVGETSGR